MALAAVCFSRCCQFLAVAWCTCSKFFAIPLWQALAEDIYPKWYFTGVGMSPIDINLVHVEIATMRYDYTLFLLSLLFLGTCTVPLL